MKKLEELLGWGGTKKDILFLLLSALALVISIFDWISLPFDTAWVAIILCGVPIILEAVIGLVTALDIKADVLVSIALIASVVIGEDFAAGEVAFIMQLGALLEDLTVARARAGIERLVHLTPRTARVVKGDREMVIPAEQVRVGDRLRVLPGETIPVDGIIRAGQTSINQAVMTGESLPVDKGTGDEVSSGTVNQFGAFEMEAAKVGEDSSIQRMIRLVQSADAGKAKVVGIADRWATWVVVIALTAAALTWLATGEIIRSVTILVVFCPCALVLATPTAIMAAIGNATRHGFLVKEGDALERLAGVAKMAFDKTGTLTRGLPEVVAARSFAAGFSDTELYRLAASAESRSEHPLGRAVLRCAPSLLCTSDEKPLSEPESFRMVPGRGVIAKVDAHVVLAGNAALLESEGVVPLEDESCREAVQHFEEEGCTIIRLALDGKESGFLALSDALRPDARQSVAEMRMAGVTPVLMTGDNERAARHMGRECGIEEIHASTTPEGKLSLIEGFQRDGESVCMVGDGINDAPALKRATVGIAMGGVGSGIAMDAADIVLVNDEIRHLPFLLRLSRHMMNVIRLNLSFSMILNFAAVLLAVRGELGPVAGALVHNAGSVLVILNSAFLLFWKAGKEARIPAGQS